MSRVTLALGISSTFERHGRLKNLFDALRADPAGRIEEVVVVVQQVPAERQGNVKSRLEAWSEPVAGKLVVYFDSGSGLSRSRNICLELVSSDYVWLLDDDVVPVRGAVTAIRQRLAEVRADVLRGWIKCSNGEKLYKKYQQREVLGRSDALRASSIELVVAKRFVRRASVRFNERLGLGTSFPSAEENVWLLDCIDKGARFMALNAPIVEHPCVGNRLGQLWRQEGVLRSKGIVARRYGLIGGLLLIIKWTALCLVLGIELGRTRYLWIGFLKDFRKVCEDQWTRRPFHSPKWS